MFLPPHLRKKRPAPAAKAAPGQLKKGKIVKQQQQEEEEEKSGNNGSTAADDPKGSGAGQTKSISLSEVLKMNIKVENYNLDKEVGGGRFGRVFSAVDTESKTTVAIKSLKLEMLAPGEDSRRKKFSSGIDASAIASRPWILWPRWVCREIQALVECSRESRENIVQLLGVCQQQRNPASDESHSSSPHPQLSDKEKKETEARSSSKVEKAEKNNDIHVANPTTEEAISDGVEHGCVSDKNKDYKALVQTQVPADSNESKNDNDKNTTTTTRHQKPPTVVGESEREPDKADPSSTCSPVPPEKAVAEYFKRTRLFIVMEYVPYELARVVEALPKPLAESQVKSLMKQLFEALAAVHRAGWVHRDVKMTNILLSESGTLKLVDFGQARPIAQQQERQRSEGDHCQEEKKEEREEEAAMQGFGTDSERPPTPGVVSLWYRPPELLLSDGSVHRRRRQQHQGGGGDLVNENAKVSEKDEEEELLESLPISQLRGRELCAIDMWSAGCILGELLQRAPLFCAKTEIQVLKCIAAATATLPPDSMLANLGTFSGLKERLERAIAAGPSLEVRFPERGYDPLDVHSNSNPNSHSHSTTAFHKTGRTLLQQLFTWDPVQRITAQAAIEHEWLTKTGPAPTKFDFVHSIKSQETRDHDGGSQNNANENNRKGGQGRKRERRKSRWQ